LAIPIVKNVEVSTNMKFNLNGAINMKLNQLEEESLVRWIESHYPDMAGYLIESNALDELQLHIIKLENILQRTKYNDNPTN